MEAPGAVVVMVAAVKVGEGLAAAAMAAAAMAAAAMAAAEKGPAGLAIP